MSESPFQYASPPDIPAGMTMEQYREMQAYEVRVAKLANQSIRNGLRRLIRREHTIERHLKDS